jgi:hypothetical protein
MTCGDCCASSAKPPTNDPLWRRALWIALGVNAGMFAVEIVAQVQAELAGPSAGRQNHATVLGR